MYLLSGPGGGRLRHAGPGVSPGGIQYGDVGRGDADRRATGRTDQRPLLAALHDHRRHPLGLQLAASPRGVVVAEDGGEFPVAGHEHIDAPSQGENVVPSG